MKKHYLNRWTSISALLFSVLMLSGCQIESEPKSDLDQIRERGVLRVGTLNNQLSYYIGLDGPAGLDYELAREFANELGVQLEMKPAYRISSLYPALAKGEIDIIAAGLTQSPERMERFRPGPAYYYVSQQVVYKKGHRRPRNLEQLLNLQPTLSDDGEELPILKIISDSHVKQTLNAIKREQHPDFAFEIDPEAEVSDLLKQVSDGDLMFTVADSVEVSLSQRIYPDIALAFELTEDQPISWFVRRSEDESLYALMIEFFGYTKQSGHLASLEEKYIGHIGSFDYVDTRAFIRALNSKLPQWAPLFKQYSEEFDWRLVAALAYQESHWNPLAKSPTGVRGMMMLTLPTAKSVGVTNRLDPKQSVRGGVDYLRRMVSRIPDSIDKHEKIWFALASYNVGYGHMMDARRLTKKQGGNPDSWADVKDRLPLLRQKKYYSQTRYGYARGDEARNYVENIRRYYQSIIGHVEQQSADSSDVSTDDLTVIEVLENATLSDPATSGAIPASATQE
ncbi:membrane-bound lytic murein transglycosylase MltF [Vibrio neptunius]|uniref:Membrane-bound lytic murein transglycosylase F n=1 Tax=Vibrio neptunius TaxID=170651 RepID=A0ABS3A7M8_9VIBR|nr:membrane-bound lytic murein transglycosylase MltF [Vibrio neptunius]MBN3495225.1 membrane-bound lytic murein transglycosylase MltF [Vibrio neptunius]MBN3517708.1 membrane-bound lytic murein transglycosylase MltF [Vibrio neptunius]MBN3552032.1 membrane-bound lytic murein transglycosylase MltF [Vibrio neptunius]MBN3580040.1 membrane-bound lytic murein transglycosylase MltF [Vibrio neptunius]MCH9873706.1 membrane-bound lytic murein transglycosylase MltF [Vibrio neptunius]